MLKKGILAVALVLLFAGVAAQKREVMLDKVVCRGGRLVDPLLRGGRIRPSVG